MLLEQLEALIVVCHTDPELLSVSSPTKRVFSYITDFLFLSVAAPDPPASTRPLWLSSVLLLLQSCLRHYLWSQIFRRLQAPGPRQAGSSLPSFYPSLPFKIQPVHS